MGPSWAYWLQESQIQLQQDADCCSMQFAISKFSGTHRRYNDPKHCNDIARHAVAAQAEWSWLEQVAPYRHLAHYGDAIADLQAYGDDGEHICMPTPMLPSTWVRTVTRASTWFGLLPYSSD